MRPCFDIGLLLESVTCVHHAGKTIMERDKFQFPFTNLFFVFVGYRNNITVAVKTNSLEICNTCGGYVAYHYGAYENCIIEKQRLNNVKAIFFNASRKN